MATNSDWCRLCSINICGLSSKSKSMLEKYVDDKQIDILAIQEAKCSAEDKSILSMSCYAVLNNAANGGCMLCFSPYHS